MMFMEIQPVNTGHVLVVPRVHYNSLLDVPPELGMHRVQVTMRLAGAIRKVTGCEDLNIVVNSGAAAGQDEPHYHVHIIPRRHGDGFDINLPFDGSQMPDRTVLDAMAVQLIAAMRDPMKGGTAAPHAEAVVQGAEWGLKTTAEMLAAKTLEIPASQIARMPAKTAEPPPNFPHTSRKT